MNATVVREILPSGFLCTPALNLIQNMYHQLYPTLSFIITQQSNQLQFACLSESELIISELIVKVSVHSSSKKITQYTYYVVLTQMNQLNKSKPYKAVADPA